MVWGTVSSLRVLALRSRWREMASSRHVVLVALVGPTAAPVSRKPYGFLDVVLDDCRLISEYVFLGIISLDEAVARLDVDPFDNSSFLF